MNNQFESKSLAKDHDEAGRSSSSPFPINFFSAFSHYLQGKSFTSNSHFLLSFYGAAEWNTKSLTLLTLAGVECLAEHKHEFLFFLAFPAYFFPFISMEIMRLLEEKLYAN